MEARSIDDFLSVFGNPGLYQSLCGFAIILTYTQWSLIQQFGVVVSYVPKHQCKFPVNRNWTIQDVIPEDNQCSMYANPKTNDSRIIPCTHGWDYTTLRGEIYLANDFDLVCDREYLFRLTLSAHFLGITLSSPFFGVLSDKLGRITMLRIITPVVCILTIVSSFSPNLMLLIIYRIVISAFAQGIQTNCLAYSAELFRRRVRTYVSLLFSLAAAFALPFQMYVIYFLLHWRTEQILVGVLTFPIAVIVWFLPESVHWLLSKGKIKESEKILRKFAKFNNVSLTTNLIEELAVHEQKLKQNVVEEKSIFTQIKELFAHSTLRRTTLSISFIVFTAFSCSTSLAFSISMLNGNLYTNFLINAGVQTLILAPASYTFSKFGRVKILFLHFVTTGLLGTAGIILTYAENVFLQTLATGMALIARCVIDVSITMIWTFSTELLPTPLRATALGLVGTLGRFGAVLAPQFLYTLNQIWKPLPHTIFGVMSLMAAALLTTLPETFNRKIPNSIEDAEMLWKKDTQLADVEMLSLVRVDNNR